jgi:LmbE family N-acetylglucosaminyl deacetylase
MMLPLKKPLKALHSLFLASLQHFFFCCARDLNVADAPGPTLVIAPHPDDETLGCGATIARLCAAGKKVHIAIVMDGAAAGHSVIITPEQLAIRRRAEALDATAVLGVPGEDVVFLAFPDGAATAHGGGIETALGEQTRAVAPGQIFSPYGVDGHPDHRAVAAAVDRLHRSGVINCPVYEYPVWFWPSGALGHLLQPWKLMRLRRAAAGSYLVSKKKAIAAHRSQHKALTDEVGWFTFGPGFLKRFLIPYELFFEKQRR